MTIDPAATAPDSYIGSLGLKRYVFNQTGVSHDNWRNYIDAPEMNETSDIWPEMNYVDTSATKLLNGLMAWEGFFKAPATGEYRFLQSCDDSCRFSMSVDTPLDPDSKTVLMSTGKHTSYRNTDISDKSETNELYK